jgi:hypothetical protein
MIDGYKKTRQLKHFAELEDLLCEVSDSKNHIVFVDGYTLTGIKHIDVLMACHSWLKDILQAPVDERVLQSKVAQDWH